MHKYSAPNPTKLDRKFYERSVVEVARDLIGKQLIWGAHSGIITETEAYSGCDDPASHAFKGATPRSSIMFGPAGIAYVYLIYGMYNCLNIITQPEGQGSGVLIRGMKLSVSQPSGSDLSQLNRAGDLPNLDGSGYLHLNGPGKICRHLNITREHNGISFLDHTDYYITEGLLDPNITTTTRIGITKGTDKHWRFVLVESIKTSLDK